MTYSIVVYSGFVTDEEATQMVAGHYLSVTANDEDTAMDEAYLIVESSLAPGRAITYVGIR